MKPTSEMIAAAKAVLQDGPSVTLHRALEGVWAAMWDAMPKPEPVAWAVTGEGEFAVYGHMRPDAIPLYAVPGPVVLRDGKAGGDGQITLPRAGDIWEQDGATLIAVAVSPPVPAGLAGVARFAATLDLGDPSITGRDGADALRYGLAATHADARFKARFEHLAGGVREPQAPASELHAPGATVIVLQPNHGATVLRTTVGDVVTETVNIFPATGAAGGERA